MLFSSPRAVENSDRVPICMSARAQQRESEARLGQQWYHPQSGPQAKGDSSEEQLEFEGQAMSASKQFFLH